MRRGKSRNGLLPSSLRIISSCLKTVSANASNVASTVRSAGASVAASISVPNEDEKDQVLWAGFDKLELGPASFKHVLLLGYANGFQVLDVENASNVCELVSMRDGPVTFLQMQPISIKSGCEGFSTSHPLLLIVVGDKTNGSGMVQGGHLSTLIRDGYSEPQQGNCMNAPTTVRFYSLESHSYVHVLRFRSTVYLVRCSPRIVAVALATQIYCFDAVTLQNKFSVLTYTLQGTVGINIGYGPMAVGKRWLAYASNSPLLSNTGRLSPQNLTPSPGVSPSTSPGSGNLVARYAVESSKHLAAGILNLGDMGYKSLSKYYQELIPDGSSSSLSLGPTRRSVRVTTVAHPNEADNAGMVVVKDCVSMEIITQFRAHTSPISALCFDPSGTLLVTASVNGHSINVFRIMPTKITNGSNCTRYDWSSSYVHLYKLYRGLTSAVIQDICFSHYSQWIAIVSSRATCHIFLLSPFGGDASLQQQNPHCDGPTLVPNLTMPWWSASSFIMDQQFLPPPSTMTLSVVSRIKNCSSGWLNTVSSVAASATGKIHIPSGAIAAVFHNSIDHIIPRVHVKANSLEHLLVYCPSGHLIQHELVPSLGLESCDSSSRSGSGPLLQFQDEELHVNAEPIQWWDVCRRSNWPEREESIPQVIFGNQQNVEATFNASNSDEKHHYDLSTNGAANDSVKAQERPHVYLSKAEVQVCSGRISVWQKSKICFYFMNPSETSENKASSDVDGEIEVEKLPCHEVEIRRNDLLPVFKGSHLVFRDSGICGGKHQSSMSDAYEGGDQLIKDASCSGHFMLPSVGSGSYAGKNSQKRFSINDDASCNGIVSGNCKASTSETFEDGGQLMKNASCIGNSKKAPIGSGSEADAYECGDQLIMDASYSGHFMLPSVRSGSYAGKNRQKRFSIIDDASCSGTVSGKCKASTSETLEGGGQLIKNAAWIGYSKVAPIGSASDAVLSSTADDLLDLDGVCTRWPSEAVDMQFVGKYIPDNYIKSSNPMIQPDMLDESIVLAPSLSKTNASAMVSIKFLNIDGVPSHANHTFTDNPIVNGFTSSTSSFSSAGQPVTDCCSNTKLFSNGSTPAIHVGHAEASGSNISVEFTQYFNEGYCKLSELDDSHELAEAVTDVDSSSSHCDREKHEDGDNDDMLGGVFAFSEEG